MTACLRLSKTVAGHVAQLEEHRSYRFIPMLGGGRGIKTHRDHFCLIVNNIEMAGKLPDYEMKGLNHLYNYVRHASACQK